MSTEATFARTTAYDTALYSMLASREKTGPFRESLAALAAISSESAAFWKEKSGTDVSPRVSPFIALVYRIMRVTLGVTLTAKYILGRKELRVAEYKKFCTTCTVDEDYKKIDEFAERMHAIVGGIEEERVKFFSNVVLGFNDALIELTGALVGFSFAFREPGSVTIAGLVTGLSASLSMAASAFQQARHEEGRNPKRAALFTGISYGGIALALVLPFALAPTMTLALTFLAIVVATIIVAVSFASAILLERSYVAQLGEMALFSLGVAFVAFIIGHTLGGIIG